MSDFLINKYDDILLYNWLFSLRSNAVFKYYWDVRSYTSWQDVITTSGAFKSLWSEQDLTI